MDVAVFALQGITSPQLIGALSRFGHYRRKKDYAVSENATESGGSARIEAELERLREENERLREELERLREKNARRQHV